VGYCFVLHASSKVRYYNRLLAEYVNALIDCLKTLKGDIQVKSTAMAGLTCVRAGLMVGMGDVLNMQGKMTEGNDYYVRAAKEIDDANDSVSKLVLMAILSGGHSDRSHFMEFYHSIRE